MADIEATLSTPVKQYPMLRDSRQLVRVNLLQYLWRETLGYLLHPDIPQDVNRVADAGTASGQWLCDLQKTNPNINKLDGYDISSESFIKPRDLPSSVSLDVLDVTGPVPEELRGKYDVVHLRLVQPAIRDGDPSPIISHVLDLLRPGGFMQWEEFDVTKIDLHGEEGITKPSNLEAVAGIMATGGAGRTNWIENLPHTLEARGLKTVAVQKENVAPWHRQLMSYIICHVVTELAYGNFDVNGPPGLGDKVRAQTAAGLEAAMSGSYVGYLLQSVVAQKSL